MSMTSPPLFDFKAGRVQFDESTGEATPLAGQGRVTLIRSSEDPSLLGMQWLPRGSNSNVPGSEELLLVPGDVEFSHVPHCQTGRVVEMKFNSSGERHYFWLQDAPKGDLHELSAEDENIINRLNELANSMDFEDNEDEDEDAMHDDSETASSGAQESSVPEYQNISTREPGPGPESGQPSAQSALYSALAARLENQGLPNSQAEPPLSRTISQTKRADHIRSADEAQLSSLLSQARGLASTREELIDVLNSSYFSQSLDQLGYAALRSPAFARELELERAPRSTSELLEELRKLRERSEKKEPEE